jgi:ABC-type glycerol-3-phosphate transport system substrate-binding protein
MFGGDEEPSFNFEQKWIKEYLTKHPNVTVDAEQAPLFPSFDRLIVALPAGEGPTIFKVYEPWFEILTSKNLLEPVNPAIWGGTEQSAVTDLYLGLEGSSRNGKVYGIPDEVPAESLLVNNRLFTEAGLSLETDIPKTWDEVAALQPRLLKKDAGGRVIQKGFEYRYTAGPHWGANILNAMVQDQGGSLVDQNGEADFNSPELVKALEMWKKNVVAPSVSNNVQTSPYQDFADEQDVMTFGGVAALGFIYNLNPNLKDKVTVAKLPSISGGFASTRYSFNYAVNPNATDPQKLVAWDLIKWLTDHSVERFLDTGSLTPRKEFASDSRVMDVPFMDLFLAELEHAYSLPRTTHWTELQNALFAAIERVVFDGMDPKASISQAQTEYEGSVGNQ